MTFTFDSINQFIPEDLIINPTAEKIAANNVADKDVFTYTEPNLKLGSTYLFQFKYIFEDGSESDDWSPAYTLVTNTETALNAPQFLEADLSSNGSTLIIKWSGLDYLGSSYGSNLERVEVFIRGGSYGTTSVSANTFFTATGTKLLTVDTGTNYYVKLRAASKTGGVSVFSTERLVAAVAPLVASVTGPSAPSSGSLTAGIDNSAGATIGFNAFIDVSWSAVNDSTLRGYRIRFRENGTSNPYSYVDSPGTGTAFRITGLSIGTTYELAVTSYSQLNDTSPATPAAPSGYTPLGTAVASGTPFIGKNVTTVGYFGASATGETGTFKFGYGVDTGKRGLVFNDHNYWYIDANQAASLKVGGATTNYIQWNGSSFVIDGDLRAKKGSFSGNVSMGSGASIYSGSLSGNAVTPTGDTGGSLNGTGYILNDTGLQFKYLDTSTTPPTLEDRITLRNSDGALIARLATITGTIESSSIYTSTMQSSNIYASTIESSNIYASTIATSSSASARRAIFNPTTHALSFYATGGAGQAHVSPQDDATDPGFILSAGSSPLTSIINSNDPAILMYKNASSGNYITIAPGAFSGSTGVGIAISSLITPYLTGSTTVSTNGVGNGRLRNISTVTTTNWGSTGSGYENSGDQGEILLVYSP